MEPKKMLFLIEVQFCLVQEVLSYLLKLLQHQCYPLKIVTLTSTSSYKVKKMKLSQFSNEA